MAVILTIACNDKGQKGIISTVEPDNSVPFINYKILHSFPHDTAAFTEGLLFHEGHLFESTGHTNAYPESRSLFGEVDLQTGRINTKAEIDKKKYFGEGICFLKGKWYQLTDSTRIGFIYEAKTFKKLGEFHYQGEGWGLTTDGSYLIMSNGTSNIAYHEPSTFRLVKTLGVTDNNGPVNNINELEWINGFIYANRWLTDDVLKINPNDGRVSGKLNFAALLAEARSKYAGSAEINGIAYDSLANRIFVTGKKWPVIFEITFAH